jgi:putative amidase-like protein
VPQSDRTTRRRNSGDERLANTLGRRDHAIRDGRPYTNVEVNLQPHAVKEAADTIILEATEEVALHFTSTKYEPNPGRDVTRMIIEHKFVFAKPVSAASTVETESYHTEVGEPEYLLVADESPDSNTDESTTIYPSEQSTYPSTYGSPQSMDCGSCSINSRPYNYNGSYAGDYASTFALYPNTWYRHFNNDCTNFVSQCLAYGGWQPTGGDYKNWLRWWYSSGLYQKSC